MLRATCSDGEGGAPNARTAIAVWRDPGKHGPLQMINGQKYLMPGDLLCAVIPTYPPEGSVAERAGHLDGERGSSRAPNDMHHTFFRYFDADGDGVLSFREYAMLMTLLEMDADAETFFQLMDLDGDGVIDAKEFMEMTRAFGNRSVGWRSADNKISKDDHQEGDSSSG